MFKYMYCSDVEFVRLVELKSHLNFLELLGKDVSNYQKYINDKIKKIQCLEVQYYKVDLIHKGILPCSCFKECDCNCLSCYDRIL